jgi:hypothetical protein
MSLATLKTTSEKVHTGEILDVLGPRLQFLTALLDNDNDYCLIKGSVPPGVVVSLHNHPERETFYVLEGEVEVLWKNRWRRFWWWYLCGWAGSFAILADR